jgi:epoxyqueuosine reductase
MTAGGGGSDTLTERLLAEAAEQGLSLVGVTRPRPSEHIDFYRGWVEAGRHGTMGYLAREDAIARRADLTTTLETVRSIVVVGDEYFAADPPDEVEDPARGIIARYARGADYHRVLDRKLRHLLRWLDRAVDGGVRGRTYVDTGPILERELARRAGLGWFGRNTMLIHPRRGSYFFLGMLLVDVDLRAVGEPVADRCGTCRACLDACPTGALLGRDEDGAPRIDARRCISYLTIESTDPIPEELRPGIGNRIYGCDICQEVCPFNVRFARPTTEPAYAARGPGARPPGVEALPGETTSPTPHPGTDAPSLVALMRMSRADWEAFSRGSPIRRAGYAGFKRNVAVAIGNWLATAAGAPSEEAVAVLRSVVEDEREEPMVRDHAAWALGRRDLS